MTIEEVGREINELSIDDRKTLFRRLGLIELHPSYHQPSRMLETFALSELASTPSEPKWPIVVENDKGDKLIEGFLYHRLLVDEILDRLHKIIRPKDKSGNYVNDGPAFTFNLPVVICDSTENTDTFKIVLPPSITGEEEINHPEGAMEIMSHFNLRQNPWTISGECQTAWGAHALEILTKNAVYRPILLDAVERLIRVAIKEISDRFGGMEYLSFADNSSERVLHCDKSPEELRNEIQKTSQPLKDFLGIKKRGGKSAKCDLTDLSFHYNQVIRDWEQASDLARDIRQVKDRIIAEGWGSAVERNYPDFPVDLIERLQPLHYWPENIADICEEKGGEDNPKEIALEHAARLCGAENYAYKLSTLRETMKKQNAQKFQS